MAKVETKTKVIKGPTTKVAFCSCPSHGQDQMYGLQQRIHNRGGKSPAISWRCTVCGTKR